MFRASSTRIITREHQTGDGHTVRTVMLTLSFSDFSKPSMMVAAVVFASASCSTRSLHLPSSCSMRLFAAAASCASQDVRHRLVRVK
jgi:hypothetical protein